MERKTGQIAPLAVIGLAFALAAFAYILAPDHSPYANRMTVEIGGKPPGYTQQFLLLRYPTHERASWLERLWSGSPDSCAYLPITGWRLDGDSVRVQKYIDD